MSELFEPQNLPDLPNDPYHPSSNYLFPIREFGKTQINMRSCQSSWFLKWKWLHYDEANDLVFCHLCVQAIKSKKTTLKRGDPQFICKGFCNWKDAIIGIKTHESSVLHINALEVMVGAPSCYKDVAEQLSLQHGNEKRDNRQCLLKILANLRFLARQGLALRGDHQELDSNFNQLLKLRGEEDPRIELWLSRKTNKYTSHDMQNELLKVMAVSIIRKIADCIRISNFFCIMCDECTDASNREQVVICIRWINDELEPQEDFIGLYMVDDIRANTIVTVIRDTLVRMNLSLAKCRAQCYDGASTMKGAKTGVAKQLCDEEPRATYIHCYGHALNLAAGDSVKNSKLMKDALETTFEVSKLISYSPKRNALLGKLKENLAPENPGFRVLCPTRWTVRGDTLKSVLENYSVLQKLWEVSKNETSDHQYERESLA